MPTGYTSDVANGAITDFPTFALRCARAFGALVMMRDDPMDAPIRDEEPSDYHTKAITRAQLRLAELRSMSEAAVVAECEAEYKESLANAERYNAEKQATRERYMAMLARARDWMPPTSEHENLKAFMVSQLTESIEFDCGYAYPLPEKQAPDAWLTEQIEKANRDIVYHTAEHAKEVERAASRNAWVKALRDSLI